MIFWLRGRLLCFFLDYLATGSLEIEVNEAIIEGIVAGCKQAQIALIGGETAEMPGFYPDGEYDVAGFAVGIADRKQLLTGAEITAGDSLLGLPAAGLHSNGFSLVRYLLKKVSGLDLDQEIEQFNSSLGAELLKPTRIYVSQVLPLIAKYELKGISHITGGGLLDNLPRILPEGLQARIYPDRWPAFTCF